MPCGEAHRLDQKPVEHVTGERGQRERGAGMAIKHLQPGGAEAADG